MYRRSGLYIGQHYGSGSGPVWLESVDCTGSEKSLDECVHDVWDVHSCDARRRDVSVICDSGKCRQTSSPAVCFDTIIDFQRVVTVVYTFTR